MQPQTRLNSRLGRSVEASKVSFYFAFLYFKDIIYLHFLHLSISEEGAH
jgi:hypothetical protein